MALSTDVILEIARNAIEDLKGKDIVHLDVRGMASITDHMLIVTGNSNRHVRSIAEEVALQAKRAGIAPLGVEGDASSDWVLVDLGDVIVHVMQAHARDFYDIERLWDAALEDNAPEVLLADD